MHWQIFGSNGQETADYSRGVLERFTRRAEKDFKDKKSDVVRHCFGNIFLKLMGNPRRIKEMLVHYAHFLEGYYSVNENGSRLSLSQIADPIYLEKIAINHYFTKSREEFDSKRERGRAAEDSKWALWMFNLYDRNEIFDDGILKYRAIRAEKFSFESDEHRANRVVNALFNTLTQSHDSLADKLETFLTCRVVAEKFGVKIGEHSAEEYALAWIYRTLLKANPLTYAEIQMFLKALPEILERPFPICKEIKTLTQENILPQLREALKNGNVNKKGYSDWAARADLLYIQKLLRLIK